MTKFSLFKLPLVIFFFFMGNLVAHEVVTSLIYLCFIYALLLFSIHWVHEELIHGYPAEIYVKVLLKAYTFDDLLYRSRDTWASKRKVVRQEGV